MTDQTLIFTPDEQLLLKELSRQSEGFKIFQGVVLRSMYAGQDCHIVLQLAQFLGELINQNSIRISKIESDAKVRQAEDSVQAVKETKPALKEVKAKEGKK